MARDLVTKYELLATVMIMANRVIVSVIFFLKMIYRRLPN